MFVVWNAPRSRATRDIDLLGKTGNAVGELVKMVKEVCALKVPPDGMDFLGGSVKGERIKEEAVYEGVRLRFTGRLGRAEAAMRIDVGFGDTVSPKAETITYPTLLDMPAPKLRGYPRETVIAEKFEAMVKLGTLNSRMKDFYDVWLLSRSYDFDAKVLRRAIERTFVNRGTEIPSDPIALRGPFAEVEGKNAQWRAFVRRSRVEGAPQELPVLESSAAATKNRRANHPIK